MHESKKLTGVIGSRLIGTDPFAPSTWSGISRFFFQECKNQGILKRAIGVDLRKSRAALLIAKNFRLKRDEWRQRYFLDPAYRRALTKVVEQTLQPGDLEGPIIQIGAMFDTPAIVPRDTLVFSYHDGNLATRLRSPYGRAFLSRRRIDQAWKFEKDVYLKLERIFTMSEFLRNSFVDDFGIPPEKVVNVGSGVNFNSIPKLKNDKDYDTREILFVGVEFERKGGHVLLNAFSKVRDVFPDATLHVVGPRSSPPIGLPMDGVKWHGFLRKENEQEEKLLKSLFSRSSLFVLPSLYEPFGIAPAEAMMHGIAAVVTGEWALKETVVHGRTGAHVRPDDVESLADELTSLMKDPDKLSRMGALAREHALANFTWESVVKKLAQSANLSYEKN